MGGKITKYSTDVVIKLTQSLPFHCEPCRAFYHFEIGEVRQNGAESIQIESAAMLHSEDIYDAGLYQELLEAYKGLEIQAPLTADDALRYGGREFEQRMHEAVKAGQYSSEWIEQVNHFSNELSKLLVLMRQDFPALYYLNPFLVLKDDSEQINPDIVLNRICDPNPMTPADTVAERLAQGSTLCELF